MTTTNGSGRAARANTVVHRPIRAAATRIQLADKRVAKVQGGKREEWQEDCFLYYDDVGLVKQVIRFRGNQMAKLRLFPAIRPLDDPEGVPIPATDPDSGVSPELAKRAQAEIERIKGASGGQAEILRLLDMNNEIAGECYLVGLGPTEKASTDPLTAEPVVLLTPESWEVRSILEVEITSEGIYKVADPLTGQKKDLDPELDTCVRVWQRHPGYAKRADCHMRGVLTDLESLVLLTNEVKAESKSRQNNGILFIPNTMSVTTPARTSPADDDADPDAIDDPPDDNLEPAATSIGEAVEDQMLEPVGDPGSPWTVLPLIVVGPSEDGQHIRYIETNRTASDQLEARISARKEAIAQGLNMPIEVAMGHANTTYANAAQIDADIFEKHLEPAAVLICDLWTIGLMQPALLDAGIPPELAERIIVWYDAGQLLDTKDPAANAKEARELGAIGNPAYRRYTGYSEDDAPEPLELLIDAILKQRTWDPGLVDAVVRQIAPGLKVPPPAGGSAPPAASPQAALVDALVRLRDDGTDSNARGEVLAGLLDYTRSLRASAGPTSAPTAGEKLAAIDRELLTKSLAVANAAMGRALERAGNRLKAKAGPTREHLRAVHPIYAAQALLMQQGPRALELAGLAAADLLDADAFDSTVAQFHRDTKHAQDKSLAIAVGLAGLSATQRRALAARQAADLNNASLWLRDNLHAEAEVRLLQPDQAEPARGEYDPDARVPTGLLRYAMAVAGGATALEHVLDHDPYVALSDNKPPGGVGTGDLIQGAITESGELIVEGYQWDYGEGFRLRTFEPHEALDGDVMESAADFVTDPEDSWLGDVYFPGDHDGCQCGPLIPVYAQAPSQIVGGDAGTGLDAPDRGAPLFGEE